MAPPPKPKTPFELWQQTIDAAATDTAWNGYDPTITATVAAYNQFLRSAPGFVPLNWKLIKAIVWTESGGPNRPAWLSRPMQIGNAGDPGLAALLSGQDGGDLVMPPQIAASLTTLNASTDPVRNIQAGTGYLLMRDANYVIANVQNAADTVHEYVVKPGDTLTGIAAHLRSTVVELRALNPGVGLLRAGQKIRVQKAKLQKQIIGFKLLDTATVARLYNTGDPHYAEKLNYCLRIIS